MRTYAFQTFYIPSGSMEPTLQIGDRIIVNKLAVTWGTINIGDIVVFKAPPAENCGEPVTDLVKRVIGVPGDSLRSKGNTIYVDNKPLDEKWTHTEPVSYTHLDVYKRQAVTTLAPAGTLTGGEEPTWEMISCTEDEATLRLNSDTYGPETV